MVYYYNCLAGMALVLRRLGLIGGKEQLALTQRAWEDAFMKDGAEEGIFEK